MLIQIDQSTKAIIHLEGDAHVIVAIRADGRLLLSTYRFGEWNSTYADGGDAVLGEIPALVSELRSEIAATNTNV